MSNASREAMEDYLSDAETCTSLFAIVRKCVGEKEQMSQTIELAQQKMLAIAMAVASSVGKSADAVTATVRMKLEDMTGDIHKSCENIDILLQRYRSMCKEMNEHPDEILIEKLKTSGPNARKQ